jgi:hypothetical protein
MSERLASSMTAASGTHTLTCDLQSTDHPSSHTLGTAGELWVPRSRLTVAGAKGQCYQAAEQLAMRSFSIASIASVGPQLVVPIHGNLIYIMELDYLRVNDLIGRHQTTDWTLVVEVQLVDGGDGAGVDPRPIYELHACQKNKRSEHLYTPIIILDGEAQRGDLSFDARAKV